MTNETTIHEKLLAIQKDLKAPKNQKNAHFGYTYRSCEDIIEAVKPLAHQQGCVVSLSDTVVEIGGKTYVQATATLTDGTGSISTTGYAGEPPASSRMDASQCTGSASTYARKRALDGLFAIDDTKDADATNDGKPKFVTSDVVREIQDLAKETDTDYAKLKEYYKVNQEAWPVDVAEKAIASLKKKRSDKLNKSA